jgi:hypothetical protein
MTPSFVSQTSSMSGLSPNVNRVARRVRRCVRGEDRGEFFTAETGVALDAFASTAVNFINRSSAIVSVQAYGVAWLYIRAPSARVNLLESTPVKPLERVDMDVDGRVSLSSTGLRQN